MKRISIIVFLLSAVLSLSAQELNFNVKINAQKLQTVDVKVFQTLEQTLREFLNNRKWTSDVYEPEERINCNLVLTIQEESSPTSFKADLAIQASRPIYNSDSESPIFNHLDRDVVFEYQQFDPLIYSKTSFNGNLSSVLAFYAYIVIGLDYDSFSPLGGQEFIQLAQDAINNIPSGSTPSPYSGWTSSESNKNRYWLAENLLSPRVKPFRLAMYQYHRNGLDIMADNANEGRAVLVSTFDDIEKVNQSYPNCMILSVFNASKATEIVEIFKIASLEEQNKVIRVMTRVDPSNASKYRRIK
jgi:hypothetical protein